MRNGAGIAEKERDQLALPNMLKVTVWRRPKDFRFVRSSRV